MSDPLSSNAIWATAPPIISTIFEYLPAKDLNSCARVCSFWNKIAGIVKNRRKSKISWFFYRSDDDDDDCFNTAFAEHVRNLHIEPKFALTLMNRTELQWPAKVGKRTKTRGRLLLDGCTLTKCLPRSCESLFTIAPGITGTTSDGKITDQLEDTKGITAIFFPSLHGVEVHPFRLSGESCKKTTHEQMGIPKGVPVKCLLIFDRDESTTKYNEVNTDNFLTKFLKETKGQLAVGGARITQATYMEQNTKDLHACSFGIALTGDNVYAASVIIPPEVDAAEGVEQKLKVLLETNTFGGQSIAFAFTCVARGEEHFGARNVESDVFRKLFPSIPLFGLFGNGEIGIGYIPNVSKPSDWSGPRPSFSHGYTTVFVIISVRS